MSSSILLPVVLALGASLMFAIGSHVQMVGLRSGDAIGATLIILLTTAVIYSVIAVFTISASYWWTWAAVWLAAAGLFRPALSMTFWVKGIHMLGPTMNATFSSASPLFAAAFGILLLDQPMTWPIALGTLAIVSGVGVAAWRPGGVKADFPLWALLLPFASILLRAIAQSIIKIAYLEVPSPVFASLVSTLVSLVLFIAFFWSTGRRVTSTPIEIRWLILAGVINAIAILLLNNALETGRLTIVSPIAAIAPVFTLAIGLIFRTEVIDWRKLAMLALVVPGVLLIVWQH